MRKYPFGKIVPLHQNPLQVGKRHQHCWENHIRTTTKTLEVQRLFFEWFFQKDSYITRDCKNLHLIVNWWFGLVVWSPGIPLWMGSLLVTLNPKPPIQTTNLSLVDWLTGTRSPLKWKHKFMWCLDLWFLNPCWNLRKKTGDHFGEVWEKSDSVCRYSKTSNYFI